MDRPADPAVAPAAPASDVSRRLDDAARLCGRLGHDLDNVLMGVMGFAELAQAHVPAGSPAAVFLAELLRVAEGAQGITRQLHQLNRTGWVLTPPHRLTDVLGPTAAGRLAELPPAVRVEFDVPDDLPAVMIGVDPVWTVVGHLVRNAAEAMPGGGRVAVSARAVPLPAGLPDALPAPLPPGDYVEVTVADAGPGVRPDLLPRVGREPFLTTKPRRRGLGLPTVARTLHAYGGGLRIESSPRGTAAVVYLPSADLTPPAPGRMNTRSAPLEVAPP